MKAGLCFGQPVEVLNIDLFPEKLNHIAMRKKSGLLVMLAMIWVFAAGQEPVKLHPDNPHYFLWRGTPTVLVTSGEHYGAVINLDFNYRLYLETLHKLGLNHTRIFLGDYLEPEHAFCIEKNTLSPAPGRSIAPWKRSSEPGFSLGGNKFDLDKWDPAYFERLKDFMVYADKMGVVVEADLFFLGPTFENHPMNTVNNINGTEVPADRGYLTLDYPKILRYQEAYTRKMVDEMNQFDNLIINICNEPWFSNQEHPGFTSPPADKTKAWIERVSEWIVDEEKDLPNKHLLSVDYTNEGERIKAENLDTYWKNISVFNHHYDQDSKSLTLNYDIPKAFTFNETGLMPPLTPQYRIQGWKYMMTGGALYNNLDFTFQMGNEDGSGSTEFVCQWYSGCTHPYMKDQMSVLLSFMNSIDFVRMHPSRQVLALYEGSENIRCLAWEGHQYALYFWGGSKPVFRLTAPAGKYKAEWIDPATGDLVRTDMIDHDGKDAIHFRGPEYVEDMALRVMRER